MRFIVPQFIDYQAKVIGPFTFKQFIYIGLAGAVCFVVYFTFPFSLFLASCFILGGGALAFSFLKINGRSLPVIISNFLKFSLTPKMYLWRKKDQAATVFKKVRVKKAAEPEEELPLKIAANSQLKKLRTQIETKTK